MQTSPSVAILVLLVVLGTASGTWACTSVQLIWMIHSKSADPLYRFTRGDKAGYIDRTGKVIIAPSIDADETTYGGEFHNGLLAIGDGQYINKEGRTAVTRKSSQAWDFSEGLALAVSTENGKWGYIDPLGSFVISPQFDGLLSDFSEGLARMEVAEGVGYIDRNGKLIIPTKFVRGEDFSDGMAAVVIDGPCFYFDTLDPCPSFGIAPSAFRGDITIRPDCKYTFIDKSGRIISGGRYDAVKNFSEGVAAVRVGDLWGYIDKTGTMVIPPKFADASHFSDGLARIRSGEQYGYIDRNGAFAIQTPVDYAEDFSEGLAVVSDKDHTEFWYINKSGQPATGKRYALASHFLGDLAHVKLLERRNTFAYINKAGREVFTYTP